MVNSPALSKGLKRKLLYFTKTSGCEHLRLGSNVGAKGEECFLMTSTSFRLLSYLLILLSDNLTLALL